MMDESFPARITAIKGDPINRMNDNAESEKDGYGDE
jgi:hypothetical protein